MKNFFLSLLLLFSLPTVAGTDLPDSPDRIARMGMVYQANGIRVETEFGIIESAEDETEALEYISQDIIKAKQASPESIVEFAWIDYKKLERGPSGISQFVSNTKNFVLDLISKAKSKQIEPDRVAAVQLSEHGLAKKSDSGFYLDHSKQVWAVARVVGSTGLRLATLTWAGLNLAQATDISSLLGPTLVDAFTNAWPLLAPVFVSTAAIGVNYDRIVGFMSNSRIYSSLDQAKNPKLYKFLKSGSFSSSIDFVHGMVNWGLIEYLFACAVSYSEDLIHVSMGLPPVVTMTGILASVGFVIGSQFFWDRAVAKYEKLQILNPEISDKLRNANKYKRGAIGSLISVMALTAYNTGFAPLETFAYISFGSLFTSAVGYELYLTHKITQAQASKIAKVSPCEIISDTN